MINLKKDYELLAEGKDYESFSIGYLCQQEHIDYLSEQNYHLNEKIKESKKKDMQIESIKRIFQLLISHEETGCPECILCSNIRSNFEIISEKIDELNLK